MPLPEKLEVNDVRDSEDSILESPEKLVKKTVKLPNHKYINSTNTESVKKIFKVFQLSQLACDLPILNTSLMITLTLLVTSVFTQKTFSKLKLIKTRLGTTLDEKSLFDLLIIS